MTAIVLGEILAEQHRYLETVGQLIGAVMPGGVSVQQRGIIETAPIGPHAIALHHELGGAFRLPRRPPRHNLGIDVALGTWQSEAFLDDADAQSPDAAFERLGIFCNLWRILPGIEAVFTCEHLEQ